MPFVAAPNIIEVEFRYTLEGQLCENRIMVDNLAPVTGPNLSTVATAAWNWWELDYAAHISALCHLREVLVTDLSAIDGAQVVYAPDTTTTGELEGAMMPNETSLCISLRSGSRGRSARGRWFMCGIPVIAMADANNVSSVYGSAVVTSMLALLSAIDDLAKAWVIVSYVSEGDPRPGGPVYYTVGNCTLTDTVVDSQRRRKPGVGS